jgi:hypothetical protein
VSEAAWTEEPINWKAAFEAALRQRDALIADADRYRFLRNNTYVEAYYIDGAGGVDTKIRCEGAGEHLDEAVDMERIKEQRHD